MLALFASTGQIEQNFSLLQLFSSGRKSHTSPQHLLSLMKVRLDGLLPSEFVTCVRADHTSAVKYVPSEQCTRTLRKFLEMFGAHTNGKESDLPRRKIKDQDGKGGETGKCLASLKRKRDQQLAGLSNSQDSPDLAKLKRTAEESAAARAGNDHERLLSRLQALQSENLAFIQAIFSKVYSGHCTPSGCL